MGAKSVTLILVVALAIACQDDDSTQDATVDMQSDVDMNDMGVDADVVDMDPIERSFVELPPLNGLPSDNRILSPEFEPATFFAVVTDNHLVRRQVYPETPLAAASARLVGQGRPVEVRIWGMAGGGTHTASIWLGTDGDTPPTDASAAVRGITVGDLDGPVTPVSLQPTDATFVSNGRAWVKFEATFEGLTGPFFLVVSDSGDRDMMLHAPIVVQ